MSLINALFTGKSGLTANQKWSEVTSRNIANANTEGYVKKEIQFTNRDDLAGGGVYVADIRREIDVSIDRMYRYEASKMEKERAIYESIEEYTAILGQPNDEKSAAYKLSDFKSELISLINNPSSSAVQQSAYISAQNLTRTIRENAEHLESLKLETVQEIKYDIHELNRNLKQLQTLNARVMMYRDQPIGKEELMDEMGRLVDDISQKMNIRTTFMNDGRVNLYTGSGVALLEDQALNEVVYFPSADLEDGTIWVVGNPDTFNPADPKASGSIEITPNREGVPRSFEFGSIAGFMHIQNEVIPDFEKQLDVLAGHILHIGSDGTNEGLFVDPDAVAGTAPPDVTVYANIDGLSQRIVTNPNIEGEVWRIKDGADATSPKLSASDTSVLDETVKFFDNILTHGAVQDMPNESTLEDYTNHMVATQQSARTFAEDTYASVQVTFETIESSRLSIEGVNIDEELQKLIVIEQSYAANSQLMKTVAEMMDKLMTIF